MQTGLPEASGVLQVAETCREGEKSLGSQSSGAPSYLHSDLPHFCFLYIVLLGKILEGKMFENHWSKAAIPKPADTWATQGDFKNLSIQV